MYTKKLNYIKTTYKKIKIEKKRKENSLIEKYKKKNCTYQIIYNHSYRQNYKNHD